MPPPPTKEPMVTGISPKEGPPGTKIAIRGENLGNNARDLIALRICQVDSRTGPCKGKGDVIVVTISGGVGTSTVQFRGFFEQAGPLQESAVWVDESKYFVPIGLPKNQPLSKLEITNFLDDPLNLVADIKGKDKIQKYPIDDIQELYPDNSGNLMQENFLPSWYLLENHHFNSYEELKAGLEYLKANVNLKTEGPYSFIKTNLTAFLGCLDSLETLNHKMEEDAQIFSPQASYKLFDQLEHQLSQANEKAKSLFSDILGNKAKADSTRNALALINRFRICFNLPRALTKWIAKGDYAMAINDYNRAKSLYFYNVPITGLVPNVQNTSVSSSGGLADIPIFKRVFDIADSKMDGLKKLLRNRLFDYPSTLEEQKDILKYLLEIDTKNDSAWESITKMASWLTLLLIDCKDRNFKTFLNQSHGATSRKVSQIQLGNPTRSDIYTSINANKSSSNLLNLAPSLCEAKSAPNLHYNHGSNTNLNNINSTPLISLYIEEISSLMTQGFYDFWQLGQAYFSGLLYFNKDQTTSADKAFKADPNKFSRFKYLTNDIVALYCDLVRAVFLPSTLALNPVQRRESVLGDWSEYAGYILTDGIGWLNSTLKDVRICQLSILNWEKREEIAGSVAQIPEESIICVKKLICDLRIFAMISHFKAGAKEMKSLCLKENWKIEKRDKGYGCTKIIKLFEILVKGKCESVKWLIDPLLGGEPELSIFGADRTNQKEVTLACTEMILAFGNSLEYLARGSSKGRDSIVPEKEKENMDKSRRSLRSKITKDKRLLYCLSNTEYLLCTLIKTGNLTEILNLHGIPNTDNIKKKLTQSFQELDENLFINFCDTISEPIVENIMTNMNALSFDWRECPEPSEIKTYALIILQNCIEVYSEVNSISPSLNNRVMCKLVENIFGKLYAIYSSINFNNDKSLIQAKLDVSCLELALSGYLNSESKETLNKIYSIFSRLSDSPSYKAYKKRLNTLQETFKKKNRMRLECLKNANIIQL
ncbi:unnamed protein product [Gordionus sp. m RMFG-2023]